MEITAAKLKALLTTGRVNGNPLHRYVIAKLLFKSRLPAFFKFSTGHYKLWFHPSEFSYQLYQNRAYCRIDEAVMRRILQPGDAFVDVGANIGAWSLYAATLVGSSGHVLAFEPHPKTATFLKRNVQLNAFSNVTVFEAAAGDREMTVMLEEKANDANNNVSEIGTVPVKMVRLDDAIQLPCIKLLKIDAEGSELQVLNGANRTLERTQFVYIECWDTYFKKRGYRSLELLKILRERGFKVDLPSGHSDEFHEDVLAYKSS